MPRVRLTIELEVLGDSRDPVKLAVGIVARQGFRVVDAKEVVRPDLNGGDPPRGYPVEAE